MGARRLEERHPAAQLAEPVHRFYEPLPRLGKRPRRPRLRTDAAGVRGAGRELRGVRVVLDRQRLDRRLIAAAGCGAAALVAAAPAGEAAFPGRNGAVVFVSQRGQSIDLWRVEADGTRLRRLTTSARSTFQPAWSPDGRRIAYQSPTRTRGSRIYLISGSGGRARSITPKAVVNASPAWSPDGS